MDTLKAIELKTFIPANAFGLSRVFEMHSRRESFRGARRASGTLWGQEK
jgi:hypothetical protein